MKLPYSFLILITFLFIPLFCNGQETLRNIEKISMLNEPIELIGLKVKGKPFDVENKVVAAKDWLQTLSLELKNISGKTIVHMQLEIEVAITGKMQHPLRLPLDFGKIPSIESPKNPVVGNTVVQDTLNPNKTVTISIRPKIYNFLLQFMQKNEIEDIEQIKLFFEFVVFEDGTA